MPNIFLLVHPLGTILGRATYSDYMIFYQGVTVGGKHENGDISYPRFSEKTACFANSSIIGKVNSGGNTIFAANSSVVGGDFKTDSLVIGHYPDNVIQLIKDYSIDQVMKNYYIHRPVPVMMYYLKYLKKSGR